MPPPPDYADDLGLTLDQAFVRLTRGVHDRRSGFRTLNLASIGVDGAPDVRALVLRGVDRAARILRFHTDRRTGKVAQLAADARVMVHGYDPGQKLQLRLSGVASLHEGDMIADQAWAASQPMSRACYSIEPVPGSVVSAPVPAPVDLPGGRANFAVLCVTFDRLEWLWLAHGGHRRARFEWRDGQWQGQWLVP